MDGPPIIEGFALSLNTLTCLFTPTNAAPAACQGCAAKISDAPLTMPLPAVQRPSKQVTAAGFQPQGSGWYVTDFRGGRGSSAQPPKPSLNLLRLPPHRLRPRASSPSSTPSSSST